MSELPRRLLVAYDVADDRRRDAIARLLSSYGDRVQFSVFIVDARPARLVRIRDQLAGLIDKDQDSLLFCDLGPLGAGAHRRYDVVGRERPILGQSAIVV